jgi:DNA-binding NtrC family response regulator
MSAPPRAQILLVDDEAFVRDALADLLARRGFAVRVAGSVDQALEPDLLAGLDAIVTDLRMPGKDGLELVRELFRREIRLPIVVLTAYGTIGSAVECMRAGASDYLLKPTHGDELVMVLDRALGNAQRERELTYLRSARVDAPAQARDPLGGSPSWQRVLELARVSAGADTAVLLLGETGSGKEEVARYIHRQSARARQAFVAVNCAALPIELFESEFFGHRRGAFTGAVADRDGRFKIAHGGTLFLDEIDSLPQAAQAKVLRVLQDGVFERLGENKPTRVDVRLICATNSDLAAAVSEGRFRADLYYRINVLTIDLPPLRNRPSDIRELGEVFVAEMAAQQGKKVSGIEKAAIDRMMRYSWPGNVRELRNVIERALLLEKGATLSLESLPFWELGPEDKAAGSGEAASPFDLRARKAEAEKLALQAALAEARGVRREAARLLGIDERNLPYFLHKHGLMDSGKSKE